MFDVCGVEKLHYWTVSVAEWLSEWVAEWVAEWLSD